MLRLAIGLGNLNQRKQLSPSWTGSTVLQSVEKSWKTKKNWLPMTSLNINFQGTLKSLLMKI